MDGLKRGENQVYMKGNKASLTIFIDPVLFQKIDEKRGRVKRNTFVEDLLRDAVN
jgi:hypothetical protein